MIPLGTLGIARNARQKLFFYDFSRGALRRIVGMLKGIMPLSGGFQGAESPEHNSCYSTIARMSLCFTMMYSTPSSLTSVPAYLE